MTTIAVKIYEDKIELVADSRTSYDCGMRVELKGSKIIVNKDKDLYVASSGYILPSNLFEIFINKNKPKGNNLSHIVDYMTKFLSYLENKKVSKALYSKGILVFKGKVFFISIYELNLREIDEIDNHYSDGTGGCYATTALHLGKTAEEAVKIACYLDAWSDLPLDIHIIKK